MSSCKIFSTELDIVVSHGTINSREVERKMQEPEFDSRKKNRRKKLENKFSFDKSYYVPESKDIKKLNKQFKKQKESMKEEELWEDWEDEIS